MSPNLTNGTEAERRQTPAEVFHFVPRSDLHTRENLVEFIRLCKKDLTVFGADLSWHSWRWLHVGQFTKHGTRRRVSEGLGERSQLDARYIDFAKAYVRYSAGQYGGIVTKTGRTLCALRLVEKALLDLKQCAHPEGIDIPVLDYAAHTARDYFKSGNSAYRASQELILIAKFLSKSRLIPADVSSWKNPILSSKDLNSGIGKEADVARLKKMPDVRALDALAEIFSHDLNPLNSSHYSDIYATSVSAILLCAPSRGQEIHGLPVDLEIEQMDRNGSMQYGFRYFAGKGYGGDIKWVPEVMVPVAKQAVERIRAMTNDARTLASYIEQQFEAREKDPKAVLRFYRHPRCPDVGDDQQLTTRQVAQALGYRDAGSGPPGFRKLRQANGIFTLNTLWQWVLDRQPEGFPWLNKKKGIKYSDALFCMFQNQLHGGRNASPVILWAPSNNIYAKQISPGKDQKCIFRRHGYLDEDGIPFKMNSHQFRHFLNTLAQRGNMTQEEIAKWSGRAAQTQNRVYNHETESEKVDRAKKALLCADGTYAVIGAGQCRSSSKPASGELAEVVHWDVALKPKPASCSDLDFTPRGANHITLWGKCEHDFLFAPCEKFADCLNCNEHHCIKSAGADDQERLARIKALLSSVEEEYEGAKSAFEAGHPGADNWHRSQSSYRDRLRQLVAILEDSAVPDGAVVRLGGGNNQTHLHRVLRSTAMHALENNMASAQVITKMISLLDADKHAEAELAVSGNSASHTVHLLGHNHG